MGDSSLQMIFQLNLLEEMSFATNPFAPSKQTSCNFNTSSDFLLPWIVLARILLLESLWKVSFMFDELS